MCWQAGRQVVERYILADNLIKYKKNILRRNSLFWFANDFEIESKYHRKTVVLLLTAHILSLQDVLRSMFFLIEKYLVTDIQYESCSC